MHDAQPALDANSHFVQFYDDDSFLLDTVGRYAVTALTARDSAVVIATKHHRDGLADRLEKRGLDVVDLRRQGRYVALDAADMLGKLMVNGMPHEGRFADVVGGVLARALAVDPAARLYAFGEMVALLCAEGNFEGAIRLESLWNDLAQKLPFSLFCAYPIGTFRKQTHGDPFLRICGEHSTVIPAESYTAAPSLPDRLRVVTALQQKATALESETAGRREAERCLERKTQELSDFLENAVEGLHGVGPDGRILWANRALLDLLGYRADEYVGRSLADFHVDRAAFDEFWRRLMQREAVYDFPATLRCKDGSERHVLIHSNGLWEDGRLLHTRCFLRDVTEQRRLEDELRRRLEELAESDRRKDEFLAMLGHELRNPLSAVRNALVTARLDPSRQARALDIASRQSDHLRRLVDDLLDVARITQGRITLRTQRVRVARTVERALEATRALVEERGHAIVVSLPGEELAVEADPTRLEQALVNLVSNAAKYTQPGGRIEVVVERRGDEAVLRVRDDGIGIPPDMLSRVFDLFAQADRALDRAQGGLGIGLTVVRRLVELHGGRVEARSGGVGNGAEFVVRLPALPAGRDDMRPPGRSERPEPGGARVVVVEDNPDAAESMMMLLEILGHQVRVAHDGVAALALAQIEVPDVMLIDIGLPGMDGYEIARRIRRQPELKRVVLVALTGYGRDEDREKALSAGFDHHLAKPVEVDTLQGLVARIARTEPAETSTLH